MIQIPKSHHRNITMAQPCHCSVFEKMAALPLGVVYGDTYFAMQDTQRRAA